jgi:hypothetical protein
MIELLHCIPPSPHSQGSALQNLLLSLDREIHNTGHFGFFSGNVTFKVGVEVYAHVLTIIPAAILGVVCGGAAILFTKLNLSIMRWRAAFIRPHDTHRIGEVLIMTLTYVGICMLLPHFFPCRETQCTVPRSMPGAEVRCSTSSNFASAHNDTITDTNEDLALTPDLFTCPYKINPDNQDEFIVYYNSMATLINPLGEDSVSRLFARGVHREFGYMTLLSLLAWCAALCSSWSLIGVPTNDSTSACALLFTHQSPWCDVCAGTF